MTPDGVDPIYAGPDGSYYTCWQVTRKLEAGEWRPCVRDRRAGTRLVATANGELLALTTIDGSNLPAWLEVRIDDSGARIVDTRRPVP